MPDLHPVRLPCGCLALCDRDGPVCVLEPCPRYPDQPRKIEVRSDPVRRQKELERRRLYKKKHPWFASKKAREKRLDP